MTKKILPVLVLLFSLFLFFYPVFLKGYVPFPGDLLVGNYAPWNTYSYLGYASGGVPHKAQGIDVVRQLYPWKNLAIEQLKNRQWPLWNPYNFSGNPLLSNWQTGAFYPLNIVFLLPFNLGWTIYVLLQPLLAFIFMYLFLRQQKLSVLSSVFGSLAFSFSLYITVWLEWGNVGHSLLWLPLLLLLVDKLKEKFCLKYVLVFVCAFSASILAGYIQQVIYSLIVVAGYFFYRHYSFPLFLKKSLIFLAAIIISLLLCSLQIFPTIELFLQSARNIYSPEKIKELLLPWWYLITVFVPDFFGNPANRNYWIIGTYIERVSYIGLVPLIFAIYPIMTRNRHKSWFFIVMALITLLLAIDLPLAQFFYGLGIPILGTTVPTRILAQFSFALAVLAAFGCEEFLLAKKINTRKFMLVPLLFLILWFGVLLLPKLGIIAISSLTLTIIKRNLLVSSGILATAIILILLSLPAKRSNLNESEIASPRASYGERNDNMRYFIVFGLIILTIFDLFYFFQKITPFSPKGFIYPKTEIFAYLKKEGGIWRFWGYGTAFIDSNFATYERLFSTDGYDPLYIKPYGELISTSYNGEIKKPLPRSDVNIAPGYGENDLRENFYRQRILNLLGVRFILYKNERDKKADLVTFPMDKYQLFSQKGIWQVYENKEVLPRTFLTDNYEVIADKEKIIKRLLDKDFNPYKTLILEKQPSIVQVKEATVGAKLRILDYQPNRVLIETINSLPKLLFLSDNYYDGWKARVDGKNTEIYRTDYTFRSVGIPQGKHLVEFFYEPESFYNGLKISFATLIVFVLTTGISILKRNYDKQLV